MPNSQPIKINPRRSDMAKALADVFDRDDQKFSLSYVRSCEQCLPDGAAILAPIYRFYSRAHIKVTIADKGQSLAQMVDGTPKNVK